MAGVAAVDGVLEALGVLVEVRPVGPAAARRLGRGPGAHAPHDTPTGGATYAGLPRPALPPMHA